MQAFASTNTKANENKAKLVEKAAEICVREQAAPTYLYDNELASYCQCEAGIWAKRGTTHQLRLAMVYTTGNKSLMNGKPYNSDDALEFIVKNSGIVSAQCEPKD